ncbi:uncharacterized protein BJ171DRAFT_498919 [Polychytrium aggregatum]|uniref:uncharacterized protein n=1 Tax=Polychytrium aggregatum TaxID=110093 RepID=UPI0022FE9B2A|nr:uncharacterized protein BJ171DRAFT_524697 [Polychytrium aggregatum]XP_052968241.1 uncharacterized protein BJ171DRAFT_498919 [Polychytrium aggregatum]KAI9193642.1 hypothetical protein BJ171DRAFT_524697 [Polychytrium aggregatum]KAI9206161.1 hypothetical protein BJ171DRAFT_498919 [Polychytrium aggregatum]
MLRLWSAEKGSHQMILWCFVISGIRGQRRCREASDSSKLEHVVESVRMNQAVVDRMVIHEETTKQCTIRLYHTPYQ